LLFYYFKLSSLAVMPAGTTKKAAATHSPELRCNTEHPSPVPAYAVKASVSKAYTLIPQLFSLLVF
jgi:hypothetical protein